MREIRKSGSEGGAGQTNVPFLPLSVEKFSPRLCVSVRGLRRRRCGGPPLSEGSAILKPSNLQEKASGSNSQK